MRYEAPRTSQEAAALLAGESGSAYVLAGGTDLLVRMKGGFIEPDLVVDIKRIDAMRQVSGDADAGFSIGAAVPCMALFENAALKAAWPGVVEAANLIGSDQIQGRCTVTGNLCNASPAADSVPGMVAAGAQAVIVGPSGTRTVPVEEVPAGPGKTTLQKGELIEAITLPPKPAHTGDAYLRFTPRTEMDIAVVSVGICLTLDAGGTVTAAKVVLGAVAPTILIAKACADAIIGTKLDAAALAKLEAAASATASPIDDKRGTKEYRTKVVGVLARRAALIAYRRAGGAA